MDKERIRNRVQLITKGLLKQFLPTCYECGELFKGQERFKLENKFQGVLPSNARVEAQIYEGDLRGLEFCALSSDYYFSTLGRRSGVNLDLRWCGECVEVAVPSIRSRIDRFMVDFDINNLRGGDRR